MEGNEFKKLDTDPRPLMATLEDDVSHVLCLKDFDTNEFFYYCYRQLLQYSKKQ